jgi:integrase
MSETTRKPKLLDQVRHLLRVKHYSPRTEENYVQWIRRFILFHNKRHPSEMGDVEITAFLNHLAVNGKVSASTQNQALCALILLYKQVLNREVGELKLKWAKKPKRLPVVLTKEEARQLLDQLNGTHWLMANLLYGSGLRLSECLQLRIKDLDFSYKQITVRNSKGDKDRVTMMPDIIIKKLKDHLEIVKRLHDMENY